MQGHVKYLRLGPRDGLLSTHLSLGCAHERGGPGGEHSGVVQFWDVLDLGIMHDLVVAGCGFTANGVLVAAAGYVDARLSAEVGVRALAKNAAHLSIQAHGDVLSLVALALADRPAAEMPLPGLRVPVFCELRVVELTRRVSPEPVDALTSPDSVHVPGRFLEGVHEPAFHAEELKGARSYREAGAGWEARRRRGGGG